MRSPSRFLAHALALLACLAPLTGRLCADPLSRRTTVDFYTEVRSRDLSGFGTRSDGRLVAGPVVRELAGSLPDDLLWCEEPEGNGSWLVGTGPSGRILEVTPDAAAGTFGVRELARVDDTQVFALLRLPDGSVLAGSSPRGGLTLVRGGKVVARAGLPSDSVFDLAAADKGCVLAACGNPGRIYRIDVARFAAGAMGTSRLADERALANRGITIFGEIRDRNVRRILRLGDGRVAAGSAPRGAVYLFAAAGGAPFLVDDNQDSEVTDLLADGAGGFYASIIHSAGEARISPTSAHGSDGAAAAASSAAGASSGAAPAESGGSVPGHTERFAGRSSLVWYPRDGFPETLATRSAVAFYRLARVGNVIVEGGGDLGELAGYDLDRSLTLSFGGSTSAQIYSLSAFAGDGGRLLALRDNPAGFAVVDFGTGAADPERRSARTRPIDLGGPARIGALRLDQIEGLGAGRVSAALSTGNAEDDAEGWSPWRELRRDGDGGFRAQAPIGRYVRVRLTLEGPTSGTQPLEIGRASLFYLPQNQRPHIQEFHLLSPNFAIIPPGAPSSPSAVTTVSQLLQDDDRDDDHHRSALLSCSVVSSPGTRVAFWNVGDASGDNLSYTFSIRRDGDASWTDLAVDSPDSYVQFDTLHLPEGQYFTRLVATQTAPRPAAERLSAALETDDLIVDHTPPRVDPVTAVRSGSVLSLSVHAVDGLSLLAEADFDFNNGLRETVEQPRDGILDGRDKTFVLEEPLARAAGATSVQVTVYDQAGNSATVRLPLAP